MSKKKATRDEHIALAAKHYPPTEAETALITEHARVFEEMEGKPVVAWEPTEPAAKEHVFADEPSASLEKVMSRGFSWEPVPAGVVYGLDMAKEPAAIGWVVWPAGEGRGGLIRRKVRLPMSIVEAHAIGPATSPDLRSTVAEKTATEMRRDAFALELDRAARGER